MPLDFVDKSSCTSPLLCGSGLPVTRVHEDTNTAGERSLFNKSVPELRKDEVTLEQILGELQQIMHSQPPTLVAGHTTRANTAAGHKKIKVRLRPVEVGGYVAHRLEQLEQVHQQRIDSLLLYYQNMTKSITALCIRQNKVLRKYIDLHKEGKEVGAAPARITRNVGLNVSTCCTFFNRKKHKKRKREHEVKMIHPANKGIITDPLPEIPITVGLIKQERQDDLYTTLTRNPTSTIVPTSTCAVTRVATSAVGRTFNHPLKGPSQITSSKESQMTSKSAVLAVPTMSAAAVSTSSSDTGMSNNCLEENPKRIPKVKIRRETISDDSLTLYQYCSLLVSSGDTSTLNSSHTTAMCKPPVPTTVNSTTSTSSFSSNDAVSSGRSNISHSRTANLTSDLTSPTCSTSSPTKLTSSISNSSSSYKLPITHSMLSSSHYSPNKKIKLNSISPISTYSDSSPTKSTSSRFSQTKSSSSYSSSCKSSLSDQLQNCRTEAGTSRNHSTFLAPATASTATKLSQASRSAVGHEVDQELLREARKMDKETEPGVDEKEEEQQQQQISSRGIPLQHTVREAELRGTVEKPTATVKPSSKEDVSEHYRSDELKPHGSQYLESSTKTGCSPNHHSIKDGSSTNQTSVLTETSTNHNATLSGNSTMEHSDKARYSDNDPLTVALQAPNNCTGPIEPGQGSSNSSLLEQGTGGSKTSETANKRRFSEMIQYIEKKEGQREWCDFSDEDSDGGTQQSNQTARTKTPRERKVRQHEQEPVNKKPCVSPRSTSSNNPTREESSGQCDPSREESSGKSNPFSKDSSNPSRAEKSAKSNSRKEKNSAKSDPSREESSDQSNSKKEKGSNECDPSREESSGKSNSSKQNSSNPSREESSDNRQLSVVPKLCNPPCPEVVVSQTGSKGFLNVELRNDHYVMNRHQYAKIKSFRIYFCEKTTGPFDFKKLRKATEVDAPEGQRYPDTSLDFGPLALGEYCIAVRSVDEFKKKSQYSRVFRIKVE